MAIGAVDLTNTYALRQASGMFASGKVRGTGEESTGEKSWQAAAQGLGIKPQTTQPVKPAEHVTGVEKPEVIGGNSEQAIASIGARGMRAYDTEMWVNQPMSYMYNDGANVGANLRVLG